MSGPESQPFPIDIEACASTPRALHLPQRFVDLERRVKASRRGFAEPVTIGDYRLLDLLGAGGFGLVFLAEDENLHRKVALKLCPVQSPEEAKVPLVEAQLLAAFRHPNIVTVHAVGEHEGDVFYTMEYVEGFDGTAFIKQWEDWRQAVKAYEAAAAGLLAAHSRRIVHGDFKPANLLFGLDGRVCVADFGLAQVILEHGDASDQTVKSHRAGTMPYMAPELLRGKPGTPATDQWALCVSLWETLYFSRPFKGETVAALLDSIERGPPLTIGAIPRAVEVVLRKGLSVDPADRYPDMRALFEALGQARSPAGQRRAKRRPWLGYVLGVACGVLLGVYGVADRLRALDPPPKHDAEETKPTPETELASPCVLDGRDPRLLEPTLVDTCKDIRDNKIVDAHKRWLRQRTACFENDRELVEAKRHAEAAALRATFTADSRIIARTFEDQAALLEASDTEKATLAATYARHWAAWAEESTKEWSTQP